MKNKKNIIYILTCIISTILYFTLKENALGLLILGNVTLIGLFLYDKFKKEIFLIESLFLVNYSLYVLYIPLQFFDKGRVIDPFYILSADKALASQVVFISGIVATISFIFGDYVFEYHMNRKKTNVKKKRYDNSVIIRSISKIRIVDANIFSWIFTLVGVSFFMLGIMKQGGLEYLFSKYVWDSDKVVEIGMMTTGIQIAFAGIAMLFYNLLDKDNFKLTDILKWPPLYIFLFIAGVKFIQGGRIQVLMAIITFITIYNYKYKRIKLKYVIGISALGLFLLGYIGYFRDYKTLIPKDFTEMLRYVFGGSAGLEYFLNSYTIFTTMSVINIASFGYLWGASILDGIIFTIPRFLLPAKDSLVMTNQKIAELNAIETISPVGGLNLAAQNLLNGYVIYTILFMVILGILFGVLNSIKNKARHGVLFYCLITPYLVISLVRNPIFIVIKEVLQFVILPYIIYEILELAKTYEEKGE